VQDTIERSITIAAPLERVWELVTEPGWWVPVDVEVEADRTPGQVVVRESEKWGRFQVEIVDLQPMTYAAFRWASTVAGGNLEPGHTTLVEFTVAPTESGITVAVLESGFAGLDETDQVKTDTIESHSGGWTDQLSSLCTRAQA
jgi:uncharacterized protein YndB with AHSA1/START domain